MPGQTPPASHRQGNLFNPAAGQVGPEPELHLQARQLRRWQQGLGAYQAPLFDGQASPGCQGDLFGGGHGPSDAAADINPLSLRAQTLLFWRWPQAPQRGAALYFVLDTAPAEHAPLLLYVGETSRADQRWKGEHDCKHYLAAYSEALARAGLSCQLNIRFWLDVPEALRPRRALEQALIRRWLPPFNKETRQRWATPFTADPGSG
jgi:hypothetical protein